MTAVQIEFKHEADGSVVIRYQRDDGTSTWERHKGQRAIYFPVHDIMHYGVEHVLKLTCGFYGLIAGGWNIREMDGKGARGPLPKESIVVENLVGLFSTELTADQALSSEEINAQMKFYAPQMGVPHFRDFSEEEIVMIRSEIQRWRTAWMALPPGNSLRLEFRA